MSLPGQSRVAAPRLTRRQLIRAGLGAAAFGVSVSAAGIARPAAAEETTSSGPAAASAGRPFRIYQITYRGPTAVEDGFRDYMESRGIPIEVIARNAELDPSRVPAFVEEIRTLQPDLIYTWGTPASLGTFGQAEDSDPAEHIADIPGVFTMVSAPVASGLVPELSSSGRNITGTSHVVPPEPQIRAMMSYRPFDRLGILYTPTERNAVTIVERVRALKNTFGFRLIARPFNLGPDGAPTTEGAADIISDIAAEGAGWLYYLPDTFLASNIEAVAPVATAHGLPGFSAVERLTDNALLSLISRYHALGQLTASKAEQILVGGVPPHEIPIETLSRFSLIVNMPLAHTLELYPPLAMLRYAEVITG